MVNQVGTVDVPLGIFGSLDTELSPPDIPEGASPANNDVVYLPGSVSTRPGLNRVFSSPIDSLGPVSYQKSFVTPTGDIKNLYLTQQDGKLWVEDVTNSPGVATVLYQSAGATYASSCTAQGREYIALSDGLHGADLPLEYDGTNLYRVSQDGPAVAPVVTSIALAPSTMIASGSPPTAAITQIQPAQLVTVGTPPNLFQYYSALVITIGSTAGIAVGTSVSVSGNSVSAFNSSWTVAQVFSTALLCGCNLPSTTLTGTGGTLTIGTNTTLTRNSNTVSCTTATNHNLQKGFQAQITGAGTTEVGGGIVSIVLNNEDSPGIAVVTTNSAHGLLPNNQVNIADVTGPTVGTAITNVAFSGGVVTITTSSPHGLSIGSEVTVTANTATAVNGEWTVAAVPDANTFTYAFAGYITAPTGTNVIQGYSASDSGTVAYVWPLANVNPDQNYFTVQTAPSATTFTIQLSYTDGTWTGGTVSFGWDGIFFVTAVLSMTSFQYQQYGPNATTSATGTVTPYGQAAPGLHQFRISYLFMDGSISAPGPPVTVVANGGQYLAFSNLPIGPSNVAARVIQATGAGGAYFFYIPVPAIVNGLQVSTATQINDNASVSALLDFSDNTLYSALAVSIPGNDLAAQATLGPCAGFFTYASRLFTWGERNKIQNLLNLGFDADTTGVTLPQAWTVTGTAGVVVALATRPPGGQYQFNFDNICHLSQSAYVDVFGAPIFQPTIKYAARLWIQSSTVAPGSEGISITLSSASTGFISTANILVGQMSTAGVYAQTTFTAATPATIPYDLQLTIGNGSISSGQLVTIDELEFIDLSEPYLDTISKVSYADNLTAFDLNTGTLGAEDDQSPIRNWGVIRQALYLITGTGLHETEDNGQTEPSGWNVDQVADNCGAFSVASVGRNPQGIGSAGKDWMMWSGPDGAQMFSGQKPFKVSQEIQSMWDAVPAARQYQCWVKNDESNKRCYFGVPTSTAMQVLVLDYRNIDGASIAENPPIHISFTGKMIVSDLTRKWTYWTIPAWCGELIYRGNPQPQMVFGCLTPAGDANCYVLNAAQYNDDDYGVIPASYTTYFFVSHEMEQALQVGSHRHIYSLAQAFISGVGTWTLTPLAASLNNAFPTSPAFTLSSDPFFDIDFGINVTTTRCAFRIQAQPVNGSCYFKLQKLVINMQRDANMPTRGSAGGSF